MQTQQLLQIPLSSIHILPGFNPRKFFHDAEFSELVSSVREHGIVQPVLLRPIDNDPDEYWIVAGERRFRAASEVGLESIPATVRPMSESQAALLATIENTQRADMSPGEEAEAARAVLAACGNDRQEAIKLLGWTPSRFEARLLLLHAAPEVLDALAQRKIKLGHAELLSQLPSDFQTATLARILDRGFSVADLRERLADFAQDLSRAPFDTGACIGCPHNSQVQASLFEDHIDAGRCANRECWQGKTDALLAERKNALAERYAAVYLDTERPPTTYTVLCEQGLKGVGKQQFSTGCRQCAHFGALLLSSPDRLGQVKDDCCFDLECHKRKVAAHAQSSKQTSPTASSKPSKAATSNSPKKDGKPVHSKKGNPVSASELPGAVVENIHAFYRALAAKIATQQKRTVLVMNTFALYRALKSASPSSLLPASIKTDAYRLTSLQPFLAAVYPLPDDELIAFNYRLLNFLLAEYEKVQPNYQREWATGAATLARLTQTDLSTHFRLDRKFLEAFTKSGIEGVLREAVNVEGQRFPEFYESSGEKRSFTSLVKRKNAEILDEVFTCGFDFSGFVPSCVLKFLGDDGMKPKDNSTQVIPPVLDAASGYSEESENTQYPELEYTTDPDEDHEHDF